MEKIDEDFRGVDVNVEETIFDFLESNVSSSSSTIEKCVQFIYLWGIMRKGIVEIYHIVSYKLLFGFRNAPFSINLVKLCIILN